NAGGPLEHQAMRRRDERSVLLVDLDGTLTDPAEGIVGSFRFALEALGQSPPPAAELTWIIGPPLRRCFAEMLGGTGDPEEALSIYRGCYSTGGLFEAVVYDGVRKTLADLRAAGARLFLCTAKPAVYAERILRHFDLRRYFEGVYGAELDGRYEDKGDLIALRTRATINATILVSGEQPSSSIRDGMHRRECRDVSSRPW